METPVLFLVFNRPETTYRVFETIRQAKPKQLFIVADGPRENHPGEMKKCAAVRAIVEKVDWPCLVHRNYADSNMGCARRVSSGISWVFDHVEEAIIIEDDCLPHPSFFSFCESLLERYRFDTRIMHISGNNFQDGTQRGPFSYYFTRYCHVWGWATWRRAWQYFDQAMAGWPKLKDRREHLHMFDTKEECRYWSSIFDRMTGEEPVDTWDHSWAYACFTQGLSVCPNVNLVSNIGFSSDGTHTTGTSVFAELPTKDFGEFLHPTYIIRNREADIYTFKHMYSPSISWNVFTLRYNIGHTLKQALKLARQWISRLI